LKTKISKRCDGTKADKVVAEVRFLENVMMEDFGSVADLEVCFHAAASNSYASEERQFAQYEKA